MTRTMSCSRGMVALQTDVHGGIADHLLIGSRDPRGVGIDKSCILSICQSHVVTSLETGHERSPFTYDVFAGS
jgi:hypothetical protein